MNNGKVAVVSGGSRGLGKAIVQALLDENYKVAAFSRSESDFINTLRESEKYRDRFYWEAADAADDAAMKQFVLQVYRKFSRIDGLVNNAGLNLDQLLPLTNDEDIDRILNLNIGSVIKLTRNVSRVMLKQNSGSIVNISSIIGSRGFKGTSVYSASKAALDGLTRSLARELGSKGIRVNSLAPGFVDTDMTKNMPEKQKSQIIRRTPMGRLGETDDMTGLVRFLLSPESSFMTGQIIAIDGGLTC
ncbi:MAG: SDR family oxidoreductase [Bacillota bacterium]